MANLWQCLSIQNKRKLARYCRKQLGIFFIPPGGKKKAIHVEPKIESLEEIDKLMRKPSRGAWHE